MKRMCLTVGLTVLLAGCGPDPDMVMRKKSAEAPAVELQDQQRIQVARIGVFWDDLSYNSRRGVYVITDMKTGREYIGVSGIGISELGSHMAGKTSATDER